MKGEKINELLNTFLDKKLTEIKNCIYLMDFINIIEIIN
jgi:hypothetical protein